MDRELVTDDLRGAKVQRSVSRTIFDSGKSQGANISTSGPCGSSLNFQCRFDLLPATWQSLKSNRACQDLRSTGQVRNCEGSVSPFRGAMCSYTSSAKPLVTVSHALPSDYPSLASILPLANAANPVERFMFRHDAWNKSLPPSHRWAMRQFQEGEKSHEVPGGPKTHILKAKLDEIGESVGFAIIRIFKEGKAKGEEVGTATGVATDVDTGGTGAEDVGMNHEFCKVWITRMNEVYEQEMNGKEHACKWCPWYYAPKIHPFFKTTTQAFLPITNVFFLPKDWSTLMVLPAYQNLGIGSAIIRWALSNLHLDSMPTWLCAQPDGYSLYKKFGWRDIEAVDIDLSTWAGPNKGYGMHRTVCMLRDPRGENTSR